MKFEMIKEIINHYNTNVLQKDVYYKVWHNGLEVLNYIKEEEELEIDDYSVIGSLCDNLFSANVVFSTIEEKFLHYSDKESIKNMMYLYSSNTRVR